jgi:hypothetical protein
VSRVVAWVPDLLFGSKVLELLRAGGHEAALVPDADRLAAAAPEADVVVVDLTAEAAERVAALEGVELGGARTLAFYSHVEAETRALAERAGLDRVVPRSRMAREGAQLVEELAR